MLALESRIARILARSYTTKEGVKRFSESSQCILQNLTVNRCHILAYLFDLRQLNSLCMIINRFMHTMVCIAAFLKSGVIQLSTHIKHAFKFTGYSLAGSPEFKSIRLHWVQRIALIASYTSPCSE